MSIPPEQLPPLSTSLVTSCEFRPMDVNGSDVHDLHACYEKSHRKPLLPVSSPDEWGPWGEGGDEIPEKVWVPK